MTAVKMGKFSLLLHTIPIMAAPVLSLQVVPEVEPADPNQENVPCGYLSKELWMSVLLIKQDGMSTQTLLTCTAGKAVEETATSSLIDTSIYTATGIKK